MKHFDFVIVGSGIAGLSLALRVAKFGTVAMVTKRNVADSNTAWAQGGVAAVTSAEDSFDLHVKDTLIAGGGLCDPDVVRTIVTEGPSAIHNLIELGVHFDERVLEDGHRELDLGKEGGHSKRRVAAAEATPEIVVLQNHMAIDMITTGKLGYTTEDRVVGIYVLDENTGEVTAIRTDRLILATGGCGKVYLYTTNPNIATGDGVAMAWRAGAAITNMEFVQFHPTCLYHPEARSFLITEAAASS
jgi:L-aspartate oxidase